jgi:hypothetical protein
MNQDERARRRATYFAIVVATAFGALGFYSWWSARTSPRAGSAEVSGPPIRVTKVASSYRALYRVENRARDLVVTTERVWFRRPFQSRVETYRGPPPGAALLSTRQSAFGVLTSRGSAQPLNIAAPPSLASGDVRVDAILRTALNDRTIVRRERRQVYGRACQVYRAGGPISAGDLERYVPGIGNFADFCVDRNGIVVEEAWTLKGRLIQRRVAIDVRINPPISSKIFRIDVPPSREIDRGAVVRTKNRDTPGLWVLPDTPKGFELLGRYGVVISSAAIPNTGGQAAGPGPASTSDVYVRGPDLLVVDQDPSLLPFIRQESRPVRSVRVPHLHNAKLIVDARMSEVRGIAPDGSVVRILGTLPPSKLLDLARRLRPSEGAQG